VLLLLVSHSSEESLFVLSKSSAVKNKSKTLPPSSIEKDFPVSETVIADIVGVEKLGVDGGVGLDKLIVRSGPDVAAEGADHANGDGMVQPKRIANREHTLANFELR